MKEQLYTIPVIDALKADSACPFCAMYDKLDFDATEYMMGPSYMQDDIRMETNKIGFCQDHYKKMFSKQNRLGLALILHTHLQQINHDLNRLANENLHAKKNPFKKNEPDKIQKHIHTINKSCYICNKIKITFDRYVDTFFYLWKADKELIPLIEQSSGFCLEHFSTILDEAARKLSGQHHAEFLKFILPLQLTHLKTLEEDLDWFINKYDYRYKDEPWKNAKDAIPRALTKLGSITSEEDHT